MTNAKDAGTFLLGGELSVCRMGFGAMRLTGQGIWGEFGDKEVARAICRRAVEMGINLFDTADSYGPEISENVIADALYPYPKGFVIATKGGLVRPGPGSWVPLGKPDYLIQCVEMSLRRLKLDCIDLYQLHTVDPEVPLEDSLGALKGMQKQGKIRFIGLSNVSIEEIKRAQKIVKVVSVQNRYSLFDRHNEDVLDFCEKEKIAFIPWYPLGGGDMKEKLESLADPTKGTGTQMALAWLLHRSKVMLPIPGTSSMKHLEENTKAASIHLSPEDFKRISGV